jgi:hypothetical protein
MITHFVNIITTTALQDAIASPAVEGGDACASDALAKASSTY